MTELPPRLRIVALGNSTAMYVRPRRLRRADGTYGELLERDLRRMGVDAEFRNEARWFEFVNEAFARYPEAVHTHCPDVVLLNYGAGECAPRTIPIQAMRYITTWRTSLHPVAARWRGIVRPRVTRFLAWFMPRAGRRLGMRTWRVPPARFRAEMQRLIRMIRQETGALVLVLTPNAPGPLLTQLVPDYDRRARVYQALLRELVTAMEDPGVRIIEAAAVVDRLGWRRAMGDGLHFTARGHREVAALLLPEVEAWLADGRFEPRQ